MIKINKEERTALVPFYVAKTEFNWDSCTIYNTITGKAFEPRYGYDDVNGVFKPVDYGHITCRGYNSHDNIIEKLHLYLNVYTEPVFIEEKTVSRTFFKIDNESEKRLVDTLKYVRSLNLMFKADSMLLDLGLTKEGEFNDTIL
jgi:hypothetical protein